MRNFTPFTKELWEKIHKSIEEISKNNPNPIAAFDVDGTLWDGDISETFFNFQIEQKLLANLPSDPWGEYLRIMAQKEEDAFIWLAQINAGISEEKLRSWCDQSFQKILPKLPLFNDQAKLIQLLHDNKFEIYFVSGSIQWAVEPFALHLGGKRENVVGMHTKVEHGVVTDEPVIPLTWREGKVEALLKATNGQKPHFASGNTMGDFALLDSASDFKLAVCSSPNTDRLIGSEAQLQAAAAARGWATHRF